MADMNKIDEAIRKAKDAQKAKMKANSSDEPTKVSDEEKKARTLARVKELAEKKEAREQAKAEKARTREEEKARKVEERAAKKLVKAAERMKSGDRGPAHMKKVEKAAAKLPVLTDEVENEVSRLVAELSVQDISRLIAHLQYSNRVKSTLASGTHGLEVGQTVRIVSSENDPGLIDRVGTVVEVRKIRVLVQVPGYTRNVYLFNSDCAVTDEVVSAPIEDEVEAVDESEEVEGVSVDEETGFLSVTEEVEEESTGTEG